MAGWQTKTLDELCEIARGGSPRPIKQFITDAPDGLNWIKIGDATASSKYIYKTKQKIKPEGAKRSRMVYEGDFLLSNSMSFGRPYIMKTSGCIHDGWLVLRDKSGELNQDYLYHFLGSDAAYRQFDARAAGSTVRNLNIDLVRSVEVPLPPLSEQERIVAILDEAFAAIATATANTEKNLTNARELFESELNRVFSQRGEGWHIRTLDELCEIARGGSPRPIKKYLTDASDGINWIKISDATASTKYIYSTKEKIRPEGVKRSRLVKEGDFLLSNSMSFGRPYIMKTSGCIHDGWLVLSDKSGLFDQDYLYHFLGSDAAYRQFDARAVGSTVRNLNIDLVRSVEVPLPPLPEQDRIVAMLDRLWVKEQSLVATYEKKLSVLAELKQSILHKAFTGELTCNSASLELSEARL